MKDKNFPRLLYIGDVPIESTVAGSALIYRLLQDYPADKLCIVEGNIAISQVNKRLAEVPYKEIYVGSHRLLHSRFALTYSSYLFLTANRRLSQLEKVIDSFKPDSILTVAHGFSWLSASELAKRYQLPLHLIVHDDWPSFVPVFSPLKTLAKNKFGFIYRQALSRLCVSPYMVKYYQKQYGVDGIVLYPSRATDIPNFLQPPEKIRLKTHGLTFAYAGSIHFPGYVESLVTLAINLRQYGGTLLIYASLNEITARQIGLNQDNVIIREPIPSQELINKLRDEADVLFVPMSFDPDWRFNMEISFPSKLTDYTAVGLPILIWGPPYCSAIRWAKENPSVVELVDSQDNTRLDESLKRLLKDPEHRLNLAYNALEKGMKYFGHSEAMQTFYEAII